MPILYGHLPSLTTDVGIDGSQPGSSQNERIPCELCLWLENQEISRVLPRIKVDHHIFQNPIRGHGGVVC